ncbi:MAG: hypothetical protein DRI57_13170 [Deltaproteobacteria bacterium]|nr:MAG: hypothetical protein DRI57_13170 [Deltaproteobacteria bacterium]
MDKEKLNKFIASIERISDNGQELARSSMGKEPGQRSQNIYWRNVKQDIRDIRKLLSEND